MSSQAVRVLKVVGIAAGALIVLLLMMPRENRLEIKEALLRMNGDPGQLCFDYVKKTLVDPRSAEFVAADVSGSNVLLRLRARTAGGTLKTLERACSVSGGELSEESTRTVEETRRLRQTTECLRKKIAFDHEVIRLMKAEAGMGKAEAEEAAAAKSGPVESDCSYRD